MSGRVDDGADDSITSGAVFKKAVLNEIEKLRKKSPLTVQVALKDGADAEIFTFPRAWAIPRTVLKLFTEPLALLHLEYLVSIRDLAAEDLLLGVLVLRYRGVDARTLFKQRRDLLDGPNCASISTSCNQKKSGHDSRLMIARLNNAVDRSAKLDNVTAYNRDDRSNYLATKKNR